MKRILFFILCLIFIGTNSFALPPMSMYGGGSSGVASVGDDIASNATTDNTLVCTDGTDGAVQECNEASTLDQRLTITGGLDITNDTTNCIGTDVANCTDTYPLHIAEDSTGSALLQFTNNSTTHLATRGLFVGVPANLNKGQLLVGSGGGLNITVGLTVDAVNIASTGETSFSKGLIPDAVTSDPCGSGFPEGSIFYNTTGNIMCFCDGTNDLKISDGAACF
jgi:hypothetical protein